MARGPEGDGENVELGFEKALITIRRLDTVLPRLHANYLHIVGFFQIVLMSNHKRTMIPIILVDYEGSTIVVSSKVNLYFTLHDNKRIITI